MAICMFPIVSKANRMNSSLLALTPHAILLSVWHVHFKSCKYCKHVLIMFFFNSAVWATRPLYFRNKYRDSEVI